MSPPIFIILLVATVCAAAAHLVWGRRWTQLVVFWMVAFVGCLLVYVSGVRLPLGLPQPGGVPLLESVVVAWILLWVASRLRL